MPRDERAAFYLFYKKHPFPFTTQGTLKTEKRGDENIDITRLNFLNGPDIKISQFGQLFLSHTHAGAFSSYIGAELF